MLDRRLRDPETQAHQTHPLVRFVDVEKSYDGRELVVQRLNLDIRKGEFLSLVGPSGSGKTTLLMLLAGFETATRGDIILEGRSVNLIPPQHRGIGMVFQQYALFPHMTVEENLAFPLESRRIPANEIRRSVDRALEMVRLRGFQTRRPRQLSGGQQQRVAVARALVYNPKLVLMDEPLGALDRQLREQMQHELRGIHRDTGVTVLYVTHDQGEALTMSDRVAVFHRGAIQQIGTPQQIYEEPENTFVAGFIGESNCIQGIVRAHSGSRCSVEAGGNLISGALAVNIGAVGSRVVLAIRPESVGILPRSTSNAGALDAIISQITFQGDHIRILATALGTQEFIIKLPRTRERPPLVPGQECRIGWAPEDCRALAYAP